jgi:TetR/AcrR family transcriptional regulator, acrAB operon repressor
MYDSRVRRTAEEAQVTRGGLLDAALAEFAEHGYPGARLEGIASRAGVTRGALYHHFEDKADLFRFVLRELWSDLTAPVFAELHTDRAPLERIERFLRAFMRAAGDDERFRALLAVTIKTEALPEHAAGLADKERAIKQWVDEIEGVLREARRERALRDGVSPRRAALSVLVFLNGVATTTQIAPSTFSPATQAAALTDVLLGGIRQ